MTGPPGPTSADPGGSQARADGQRVEVRTYEGELFRIVPASVADALVQAHVADEMKHSIRLKAGIRWLPPRLNRLSERPDLDQMRRRDPQRYAALWRGTVDARVGKGALGRSTIDGKVGFESGRRRV